MQGCARHFRFSFACIVLAAATTCAPAPAIAARAAAAGKPTSAPAPVAPATQPVFEPFVDPDAPPDPGTRPASGAFVDPDAKSAANAPAAESAELMLFKDIPVVIAAGKRAQATSDVAASVTLVTADDIDLFGYRSIADVLRSQRSFYLHTDGLNWFAGVRGFLRPGEWNGRIMLLVDGTSTREVIYGQTHIDQDFVVPIEAVDRVEVIRGPGSALYGTGAVFGVINVVTKTGEQVNGLQVKVTGGTQDTARISALFGTKTANDWDILIGGTGYSSQGTNDIIYDGIHDAAHNFGHIRNSDYEGVESAFLKIRKGEFTLEADFESRQKDNRSATYLASFSEPGAMHEERANITARIDHDIAPGQSLHASLHYGHYIYDQYWLYAATTTVPAYFYNSIGKDDWLTGEVHYDWQVNPKLHLLAGVDATQSIYTHQEDTTTLSGVVLNIPASYSQEAIFAEGEYKFTDWLSFVAGGRVDQVQRVGSEISPRAAAIIKASKQDTIKLLYGRAFRAPNLFEQLYASPGANVPNPGLKAEVVDTYEAVWEREFGDGLKTSLNGYVWKMTDAMENFSFPDGAVQTRNGPTLWAHGLEAEIGKQWNNGARARTYGTVTRAEHDGDGLTHSPQWIIGLSAAVPIFNARTFLALEPQVVGPMKIDTGDHVNTTFITNVVLTSRDIVPGWNLQAGAYDLFANSARFPRDGAFNQYQPTLDWPSTRFQVSLSHQF